MGSPCPKVEMVLSDIGRICDEQLHIMLAKRPTIILHEYVIMPNHVHILLDVGIRRDAGLPRPNLHESKRTPQADVPTPNIYNQSLWSIIGGFKSAVSRHCSKQWYVFARQTRYHDHIVRDEAWFLQIKYYIRQNPFNRSEDSFYELKSMKLLTHTLSLPVDCDFSDPETRERYYTHHNAIISFQKTFLSNFYPAEILFDWVVYPSVEHAYQSQKYESDVISTLSKDEFLSINETLACRWHCVVLTKESQPFQDPAFTSWNIKVLSSFLDEKKKRRSDRNDVKIEIMRDCLIQKYSNTLLQQRLQETSWYDLIEWNTWWDTFWWVSWWEGENYLWRMLMTIREKIL